ncbi:MAG: MFS transporter [bacterium]
MKINNNLFRFGWLVVINLSIVSFLSDFVYEGSRSILGQYFLLLNIPVFYLALVSGFSEFIGYSIRYFIGYFIDKFKESKFLIIYIGYFLNLINVPLLYFANNFYFVFTLVFLERFGKGLRIPPRDSVFYLVSKKSNIDSNKIFGIHHLMDQLGAFIGPLFLSFIFYYFNFKDIYHYKLAFLILGIPIFLVFLHLFLANYYFNKINQNNINDLQNDDLQNDALENLLENKNNKNNNSKNIDNYFAFLYIFSMIIAFGYIDFPIILYYFKSFFNIDYLGVILYSLAMISSAFGGFISSSLFKKYSDLTIIFCLLLIFVYPILLFFIKNVVVFVLASLFWGWALGSLETIFKILVSLKTLDENIGKNFGLFHTLFGLTWFIGSLFLGFIYQKLGFHLMFLFSSFIQLLSLIFFILFKNKILFHQKNINP